MQALLGERRTSHACRLISGTLRFQFRAELQRLRSAASMISGKRPLQSWPLRVNSRTPLPVQATVGKPVSSTEGKDSIRRLPPVAHK